MLKMPQLYDQKVFSSVTPQTLCWGTIAFGILVRTVQYIFNRSLWADESVLALNIVDRSYLELLQPLDYNQGAPVGFLWVEKLAVQVLGNTEYALRLFPFVASIISFFLFYSICKRLLQPYATAIALALFSCLEYLVYYAAEVKQYSSDVMVALLLVWVLFPRRDRLLSPQKIAVSGIVGAIAIWMSHPAVFVLAAMGSIALYQAITNRKKSPLFSLAIVYGIWLASFVAFYFISVVPLTNNPELMESWGSAFPSEIWDINWLYEKILKLFKNPLGFSESLVWVALVTFAIGCFSLFRRDKTAFAIVLSPLFFTIVAAYLQQYPFRYRLLLFLTPFLIIAIAEGVMYVWRKTKPKLAGIPALILLGVLLFPPAIDTIGLLVRPQTREEIRPVLEYVRSRQEPGDILYIFQRGEYQFQYYADRFGYQPEEYIIGVDDLENGKEVSPEEWLRYQQDLDALADRDRVWLLFSHTEKFPEEEELVISYIDSMGKRLDAYHRPGAFVFLYDFQTDP